MSEALRYSSAEYALLMQVFGHILSGSPVREPEGLDWGRIESFIEINNAGPLFMHAFGSADIKRPKDPRHTALRMRQLNHNIKALKVASRLFSAFDEAGLPSVGLRGVSLLQGGLYPDASVRPMKDVDLLVEGADHDRVEAMLKSLGVKPEQRLRTQVTCTIEGVNVEVHLRLLTAKRYMDVIDTAELMRARRRIESPEGVLYSLPVDYELIELILHAFVHHEMQGLFRALDIALVLKRHNPDLAFIHGWAERAGVLRMFSFTLRYVDRLFGLSTDFGGLYTQVPGNMDSACAAFASQYFGGDSLANYLRRKGVMLYTAEGLGTKLRQAVKLLTTRELMQMYHSASAGAKPSAGAI